MSLRSLSLLHSLICLLVCFGSASGCTPSASKPEPSKDASEKNAPDKKPATAPGKGPTKLIGISILTTANPFFVEISEAVKQEALKAGYELVSVSGEYDSNKQQNQVKDFIVQKVAAIILTPCDSRAVGTAIQEANAAGIPVFTADIASIAAGAKVVTHVATDNYSGGRQAAIAMIEALGGKGKVAILDFPQVESVMLRTKAIRDGKIYADPIQFPVRIGQETLAVILKYLNGEDVPSEILIPTELYRQADAKSDASL